jgi:hypothetical protein
LDSLFTLTSWELWKERNARLFRGRHSSMIEFLQVIKVQAELWVAAGAEDLRSIASRPSPRVFITFLAAAA